MRKSTGRELAALENAARELYLELDSDGIPSRDDIRRLVHSVSEAYLNYAFTVDPVAEVA